MVHELGICVFVCIFAASLCALKGIFMCIWGGGGGGAFSWEFYGFFCVHFSQFCDLIGIQILHNIRLWHHVAYIFAARVVEYISAFRYILNK